MTELIQHPDDRKESDVVENPDAIGPELLDGQKKANSDEETEETSLRDSLKAIFSWRNYSVYLTTGWAITSFSYMGLFLSLYLIDLNWEYVLIGALFSTVNFIAIMSRFIGGYVGDVVNRKYLAAGATLCLAIYNLLLGLSIEFSIIFIALLFGAVVELFKGGSSAFIMENIPKKHSGLGISLFTSSGRFFGVITLAALVLLVPMLGFGPALRSMFFVGGILLLVSAAVRAILLEGGSPKEQKDTRSVFRAFFEDNKRTAGILFRAAPGLLAVVVVDGLSDSLFKFGANIYIYEVIGIGFEGIAVMTLSTAILSIPLLLKTGRMTDRKGVTRAALIVYSAMPICAALMILSPYAPYWAPQSWVLGIEGIVAGLGAIFSTPFIAVVIKSANDAVWYLILFTLIQKNLPKKDSSKILGTFWFVTYLSTSIGPYLGGLIFQLWVPQYLFVIVLALNIAIMAAIHFKGLINVATASMMNNE
jgi:MFS family permease